MTTTVTPSLFRDADLAVLRQSLSQISPDWRELLEVGESLLKVCLENFREIDGVLLIFTDETTGERVVAVGRHPRSRFSMKELLPLLDAAVDVVDEAMVPMPLHSRGHIVAGARLYRIDPGVTVMRVEMAARSTRAAALR